MRRCLRGLTLGFFILVLSLAGGSALAQDNTTNGLNDSLIVSSGEEEASCDSLRSKRRAYCKEASHFCSEVHEYDAFNYIKRCAYFSKACHNIGEREEVICHPPKDSRLTLNRKEGP